MAEVVSGASSVAVIPSAGPPGVALRGAAGRDGINGAPGRDGIDGVDGAGVIVTRAAMVPIPAWTAVISVGSTLCRPADPSNPDHRGLVIGVTALGGLQGSTITIQTAGDVQGDVGGFPAASTLFVGAGGAVTGTAPTSGWRQTVGKSITANAVNVVLGEAQVLANDDALLLPDGGLATRATASDVQAAAANDRYLTPAAAAALPFQASAAGAVRRTLLDKVAGTPIQPRDYLPASFNGNWGPVLTAAGAAAAAVFQALDVSGIFFTTSPVTWPGNLRLTGKGYIVGQATTPQTCIVEMINGAVVTDGSIEVMGQYNPLYDCGYWVHGEQVQYLRLTGLNASGVRLAYRLGDRSRPGALLSEGVVGLGSTYGCPQVCEVISVEGYIEIQSPIWSADNLGVSNDHPWAQIDKFVLKAIGASVGIGGGHSECTGSTNGTLLIIEPLVGPTQGLVWGQIFADRLVAETALPLALAQNPAGLTGPNNTGRRGVLSFANMRGAHSQDTKAFIYGDASFDGRIIVDKSCNFWFSGGSVRSQPNIFCLNVNADVEVDEGAFDTKQGFQNYLAGTAGGTAHYKKSVVLFVEGLSSRSFAGNPSSPLPLVFQTVHNFETGAIAKFAGLYNQSTGEFTIPPEGMLDVTVTVRVKITAGVTGRLYIFQNGAEAAEDIMPAGGGSVQYYFPFLPAGTKLQALIKPDASTSGDPNNVLSTMKIEASR